MLQNALFVAAAALLSLTAIPIQVLATNYPHTLVDIRYPFGLESDFTATIRFVPREPEKHVHEHPESLGGFIHEDLEHGYADQLAQCYSRHGTWDHCGYPTSRTKCYCRSWHHRPPTIVKAGSLYTTLLGLLQARATLPKTLVRYLPDRPDGTDPTVAVTIYLGEWEKGVWVYDERLARELARLYGNDPYSNRGAFLNPNEIPFPAKEN